jgi:predicted nucleic acid-binding Zn ribbon protein
VNADHDDREPARLRDTLAAVGADLGLPAPEVLAALRREWPAVAGAELAAVTRIAGLRDGVLTVVVDGPGWATKLRYLEREVVDWAARTAGAGVVERVRIRVDTGA